MTRRLAVFVVMFLLPSLARAEDPKPATPPALETRSFRIPLTPTRYEFVRIPGGTVTVPGPTEDDPPLTVQVKSIWIGKTEITWDCYEIWALKRDLTKKQKETGFEANSHPSEPYGDWQRGFGNDNQPAIGMSYQATQFYCAWLEKRTGVKFRLPTEAEWIHAARAGATADIKDRAALARVAWFADNADHTTHTVAALSPNAFGLYDMLGNAAEYVEKFSDGSVCVKGGAYSDKRPELATLQRHMYNIAVWQSRDSQNPKSNWWYSDAPFAGFRLVCDQDPTPKQKYQ